jgi:nitrogen fixation protein FixH
MTDAKQPKELTGRHVAMIFCGAFSVIIGVNLALAYSAVGTFPGLETRAPYNESLTFEARRAAQQRLNWASVVSYDAGQVTLTLTELNGNTVVTPNVSMVIRHATSKKYDQDVELYFDGHKYVGQIDLPPGNWQARISATALDGTDFRRTLSLYLRPAS